MSWLDRDEDFRCQLAIGHAWEQEIARRLCDLGLPAEAQELRVRPDASERNAYSDAGDLTVGPWVVEVKSRSLAWTSVESFPYEDVIVDSARSYHRRDEPPVAYVVVSQQTGYAMATSCAHADRWIRLRRRDRVRRYTATFLAAPRDLWQPLPVMAAALREALGLR